MQTPSGSYLLRICRTLFGAGGYPGNKKVIRARSAKYFRKARKYNSKAAHLIKRYELLVLEANRQAAIRDARERGTEVEIAN